MRRHTVDPGASTTQNAGIVERHPGTVAFCGTPRFTIIRRIGAGAMGVVFEAQDHERGTRVALKTLRDASPEALLRFKEEFRSHANVYHEHLVRLGELVESDEQWFFTMELVQGVHFLTWIGRELAGGDVELRMPLTVVGERRLRLGLGQLASALRALHAAHRVHRDIKSSNVLVTAEDRLVVVDFGVVGDISRGATADGAILGTPTSMAPEQAAGGPASPAADWYAVGVMLYQALTGQSPFSGPCDELLRRKQAVDPAPPHLIAAGVPPDLEALCLALLSRDPADRAGGEDCLRCVVATGEPPGVHEPSIFVGRNAELDVLRAALAQTVAGASATLHLEGESGIGKSELARRFTEELAAQGRTLVLYGRCYEHESVSYKAVDGIVDALARRLAEVEQSELAELLAPDVALLARTFPVLNGVAAIAALRGPPTAATDPRALRADMFAAFRELVHCLARRSPLVVLIDDVHWADADSVELLGELMRSPGAPPLLLVLVSRGISEFAARLPGLRRLEVGPLSAADADQLIDQLAGASAPSVDHARIGRETGGHPLFINELVRHRLQQAAGQAVLSLEGVLWQRIAGLDEHAQRLLELLAVSGQPARRAVLAAAHGAEPDSFERCVALLLGDRLARTLVAGAYDEVDVYHDRIRRAVLAHMGNDQERHVHALLAQAYEEAGADDPEILATHWHAAGDVARAIEHTIRAARRAASALAFDRAARLAEAALALLPGDAAVVREIRVELGDALANGGESLRAAHAYLDAARASEPQQALELQRRAVEQYLRSGHVDEGLATARTLLSSVGMGVPGTLRRALLATLWQRARLRVRGFGFEPRDASAIPNEQLAQIDVTWTMVLGLGAVDHIRAAEFQSRHLMLALLAGEPRRVARAMAIESAFVGSGGLSKLGRARRVADQALALAEDIGDPRIIAYAAGSAGTAACLAGEWREALPLLERAEGVLQGCNGADWELVSSRVFRLTACNYLGDYPALTRISGYVWQAQARGDLYTESMLVGRIGWMVSLLGDQPGEARRQTSEALQRWTSVGFHTQHRYNLHASTSIGIYAGDALAAYRTLEATWHAFRSSFLLRRVPMARIEMFDVRGRAALAAATITPAGSDRDSLVRRARRDAGALERERAGWARVLATLLRAGAAAASGQRDEALSRLAIADELAGRADMLGHRMVARRRYGETTGGDAGAKVVESADAWLRTRGVANPDRFAGLLAPGF